MGGAEKYHTEALRAERRSQGDCRIFSRRGAEGAEDFFRAAGKSRTEDTEARRIFYSRLWKISHRGTEGTEDFFGRLEILARSARRHGEFFAGLEKYHTEAQRAQRRRRRSE